MASRITHIHASHTHHTRITHIHDAFRFEIVLPCSQGRLSIHPSQSIHFSIKIIHYKLFSKFFFWTSSPVFTGLDEFLTHRFSTFRKKKFAYVKSVSESLKTKRQQNDMNNRITPSTIALLVMLISIVGTFTCIICKDAIMMTFMFIIFILSARIVSIDNN